MVWLYWGLAMRDDLSLPDSANIDRLQTLSLLGYEDYLSDPNLPVDYTTTR